MSDRGFILFTVLLFLFVMTLLVLNATDDLILADKMEFSTKNNLTVFSHAEMGLEQVRLKLMGKEMILSPSNITLDTSAKILHIDACGNQTVAIQSIATNRFSKTVLNSIDIFARVPFTKNCKILPNHQCILWMKK